MIDGSFMPTAGASNPSITMIANAYRVCSQIPKEPSAFDLTRFVRDNG